MIVFPMAGLSSRFAKAGYDRPKWMLPLAGRPLLDWSLMGFSSLFDREPFLIVHLDHPDVAEFVRNRIAALGISRAELVALSEPTRGQAESVAFGLDATGPSANEPLTIFNIDTIRPGYAPSPMLTTCSGWLECFQGEGDHWSFVRPAPGTDHRAAEVTEKLRISSLCCTGLYYFNAVSAFREAFEAEKICPSTTELYVAPLYQRMIEAELDVRYGIIGDNDIFFSGTPSEYETLLSDASTLTAAFA